MTTDLRTNLGVIAGQRQAVIAEGPDALTFLQGQLSQDLEALAPGDSSWSLVLHPQGKISAWFRIARVTDDRFIRVLNVIAIGINPCIIRPIGPSITVGIFFHPVSQRAFIRALPDLRGRIRHAVYHIRLIVHQ